MTHERCVIAKFGGTSLASAEQFRKVKSIVDADPSRRYIVPSAPGKRNPGDRKVTDLLIDLYDALQNGQAADRLFSEIRTRYEEIRTELELQDACDLDAEFSEIRERLSASPSRDYVLSRGEYLNGLLLAAYLDRPFIDAAEVIFFDANGELEAELTNRVLSRRLARQPKAVIPGFYGSMPDGTLKTFSRGGSDITGSLVARAAHADLYENWTDVSGFLAADPRIIDSPRYIGTVTYHELRELSYMGASVLHEDATFPVKWANIPIRIRNTWKPDDEGTFIVPSRDGENTEPKLVGIAGREDLCVIHIEKDRMDTIVGYAALILDVLASHGIAFHHTPAGIDALDILLSVSELEGKEEALLESLESRAKPDLVRIERNLALFAVVGTGLSEDASFLSAVFKSLADASVPVRIVCSSYRGTNLIVGVAKEHLRTAIRAVYGACG